MKKLNLFLAIAFSIFILQSCVKDPVVDLQESQTAPQLPAVESFIMPFQDFSEDKREGLESRTVNNFSYSVGNILIWNSLLNTHLRIPVLSFVAALNQQAEYQGSGVWLWAYDFTDDQGNTFNAELYGELLASEEIKWDMYVSKVGGFQDMHWYSGITANDNSIATWTINFDVNNPRPFIKIDFERNNGYGAAAIRYTNIIPNEPGNGGYIEYREGEGAADGFDRAYDVYKIEMDNLLEINWDELNKNGRVKDVKRYYDDEWHCWGTNYQDIDC